MPKRQCFNCFYNNSYKYAKCPYFPFEDPCVHWILYDDATEEITRKIEREKERQILYGGNG